MCLHIMYSVRTWHSTCAHVNGTVRMHAKRAQCTYTRAARTRREINTYMRTVFCLAKCDRGWCLRRFPSTAQWQRAKARDWPCSCPTCKQPTPPSAGCAPLASCGLVPPSRGGFGSPPRRPRSPPPWEGGCPPRRRQGNCRGGRSSNRPRTRAVLAPASGGGSKNRRGGSGLLDFFPLPPSDRPAPSRHGGASAQGGCISHEIQVGPWFWRGVGEVF